MRCSVYCDVLLHYMWPVRVIDSIIELWQTLMRHPLRCWRYFVHYRHDYTIEWCRSCSIISAMVYTMSESERCGPESTLIDLFPNKSVTRHVPRSMDDNRIVMKQQQHSCHIIV